MRPRTRPAVSGLVRQIGSSTCMTRAVSIAVTGEIAEHGIGAGLEVRGPSTAVLLVAPGGFVRRDVACGRVSERNGLRIAEPDSVAPGAAILDRVNTLEQEPARIAGEVPGLRQGHQFNSPEAHLARLTHNIMPDCSRWMLQDEKII